MSWAQRAVAPKSPEGAGAVGEVQGQEGSADEGNRGGAFTDTQVYRRGWPTKNPCVACRVEPLSPKPEPDAVISES